MAEGLFLCDSDGKSIFLWCYWANKHTNVNSCAQCLLVSGFNRSWSQNRWHFRQSPNSVMQIGWSDNSVQQSAFKTENSLRGDDPYVPIAAENFKETEGGECLLMSRLDTQINRSHRSKKCRLYQLILKICLTACPCYFAVCKPTARWSFGTVFPKAQGVLENSNEARDSNKFSEFMSLSI